MKSRCSRSCHSINRLRILTVSLHDRCFWCSGALMEIRVLESLGMFELVWNVMMSFGIKNETVVGVLSRCLRSSKESCMLTIFLFLYLIHVISEGLSFIVFPICFWRDSITSHRSPKAWRSGWLGRIIELRIWRVKVISLWKLGST